MRNTLPPDTTKSDAAIFPAATVTAAPPGIFDHPLDNVEEIGSEELYPLSDPVL